MSILFWAALSAIWLCVSMGLLVYTQAQLLLPIGLATCALVAAAALLRPRWAIPATILGVGLYAALWLWLLRETANPAEVLAAATGLGGVLWFSRGLRARLEQVYRRAGGLRRRVEELSTRHPATGALKLEAGRELIAEEVERGRRYHRALALLRIGPAAPEEWVRLHGESQLALLNRTLAELLRENLRTLDRLIQFGRAEYLVLLPETTVEGARVLANRVAYAARAQLPSELRVGIVEFPTNGVTADDLVAEADAALSFARATDAVIVSSE